MRTSLFRDSTFTRKWFSEVLFNVNNFKKLYKFIETLIKIELKAFKMNLKCANCEKTESILWRKNSENGEVCNDCYESEKCELQIKQEKEDSAEKEDKEATKDVVLKETVVPEAKIRKSTRSTRFKNKAISRQKSKVNF